MLAALALAVWSALCLLAGGYYMHRRYLRIIAPILVTDRVITDPTHKARCLADHRRRLPAALPRPFRALAGGVR
ncbi:hypothetical protein [Micromonospora sp. DT47]|uniref:hypothetical protein n=1 Tax=Micromonospora sp. DT47 TaxID=3393431 RepID=UPI003CF2FD29